MGMADRKSVEPSGHRPASSPGRRLADSILNLLYPESCLACATPVSRSRDCGVCAACWQEALQLRITGPMCPSCGLAYAGFIDTPQHLCGTCALCLPPYSGARSFGWYRGELSRIIQALKFGGRRNLARRLAPLMAETFLESWSVRDVDCILPIPLHPKRKRERGYNQAELLGAALAGILDLPFRADCLARVRNTPPQVGLSDAERLRNLKQAFACASASGLRNQRVLLIDDVMTTGSTVASAAQALLEGGALRVTVLTVARAAAAME